MCKYPNFKNIIVHDTHDAKDTHADPSWDLRNLPTLLDKLVLCYVTVGTFTRRELSRLWSTLLGYSCVLS